MEQAPSNNDTIVLIGTGMGLKNQKAIADALTGRGFQVEILENPHKNSIASTENELSRKRKWPRDAYVYNKGQYYRVVDHGKPAEGGCVRVGNGYLMISDVACDPGPEFNVHAETRQRIRELVGEQAQAIYGPETKAYAVHSKGLKSRAGQLREGHIDYHSCLLPNAKILLVDEKALKDDSYHRMAKAEGLTLIPYDQVNDSDCEYPLNALVVPDEGKDVVFYDKRAEGLTKILSKHGVEGIPIDITFEDDTDESGAINCSTNVRRAIDNVDSDYLLGLN